MKKKSALVFFFTIIFIPSFAQAILKGITEDSLKAPLPFVSVSLLASKDSSLVNGIITNEKGEFVFKNVSSGMYFIKASNVGYEEVRTAVFSYDSIQGYEVPVIVLKTINELKRVSVTAFKDVLTFENGMVVMNVENSAFTTGNTVFNLLKKMPGVTVDNSYNISINGSAAQVMIDGRLQQVDAQQLFSLLNGMSAESVSKIEVMNTPGVKYDAGGSGGMINIVTKKIKIRGTSGSIQGDLSKGEKYRGGIDAALNYKGKKITLVSNLGYLDRVFNTTYVFNKTIRIGDQTMHMDQQGNQVFNQRRFRYKVGADYELGKRTVIGFLINGGPVATPSSDVGINQISGYNMIGFDHSPFRAHVSDNWSNPNYNIIAEHQFDTSGTTLSFTADYTTYKGKRSATSENYFSNAAGDEILPRRIFLSKHVSDIRISTQKLDFKKNLTSTLTFETGAKATFVNSKNTYTLENQNNQTGEFELDTGNSNKNLYLENITAGYVNFKKQFKHASMQIGLRGEHTYFHVSNKELHFDVARNYFFVFPTITFDYPRSDKHSFNFSLTRRIDRQNYTALNPYKSYQDAYTSSLGNSGLLPQTVYQLNASHTYKHKFTNTFSVRYFSNLIMNYEQQEGFETVMTVKNITSGTMFMYSPFIQQKITNWWNCTFSGYVFAMEFVGEVNHARIDKWVNSYFVNINNDYTLKKGFKFSVGAFYAGPNEFGIQYFNSKWGLDLELKKSFLNDKLHVSLALLDVFYKDVYTFGSKFQAQDILFTIKNDTRRIQVGMSYNFGKVKAEKREELSNDQEKDRLENK
jgi:hypothetical protein